MFFSSSFNSRMLEPIIGINLTDPTFQGIYHDKRAHPDDLTSIIQRAQDAGCQKLIVTGSDLEQSKKALQLAEEYPTLCYATIGIHPCSSTLFTTHPLGPTSLLSQLSSLAHSASLTTHCVAFGEIGLDYDRLTLCAKETQQQYFSAQLCIAASVHLPLFLHSRAAHSDFIRILNEHWDALKEKGGVVHSFTGTVAEMQDLVDMGLYIGVNGCSLKTAENLDVVRAIPLGRMMLETDGPWCEMRPSHASASYLTDAAALPKAVKKEKWVEGCMVKGRNEPCAIGRVTHVVARVKGVGVEEVCEA
ncbi:MAG: hypothetical protein M1836_005015 [Candelina mexicana]|nr:MAG: hypothetical protein M1836_005015 [Candelina mexicana]